MQSDLYTILPEGLLEDSNAKVTTTPDEVHVEKKNGRKGTKRTKESERIRDALRRAKKNAIQKTKDKLYQQHYRQKDDKWLLNERIRDKQRYINRTESQKIMQKEKQLRFYRNMPFEKKEINKMKSKILKMKLEP